MGINAEYMGSVVWTKVKLRSGCNIIEG